MSNDKINALLNAKNEITDKRISLHEKTLSYISELSEILIDEADEDEIFFRDAGFISRYRALTEQKRDKTVAPFNEADINTLERQLTEAEKALLCLRLTDILGILGIEGVETFFDEPPKTLGENVSTVKSRGADDAYIAFASSMAEPRVSYVHDLNEVCENVLYGKTAYGILPLSGAKALLLKYGLKTAKRVKIKNQDGTYTTYSLIKRELNMPKDAESIYFELAVKTNDPSALIIASEVCSMELANMNYSSEDETLTASFKISESDFCGFLSYLSLNYPDYIPLGIYEEI